MNSESRHIFFLGIGGIGMSALARYFHLEGNRITGYDREITPLTKKLGALGIEVLHNLDEDTVLDKVDLVIYTPAIKKDQIEYQYFSRRGVQMEKRSESLMKILKDRKVIAVAGTHGKTTTAALLAHILTYAGQEVTAFVGGIMSNYQSNFIHGTSEWVIVEADEYDRSFWRLFPEIAIIQAMDADHLDIYGTHEEMVNAYRVFTSQIKDDGHLFVESRVAQKYITDSWQQDLSGKGVGIMTFGLDSGQVMPSNLKEKDGTNHFSLDNNEIEFSLSLAGQHNVQNALAAIAVARYMNVSDRIIAEALEAFSGISRRFEYILRSDQAVIIDDYAHHPKEIEASIKAAREHHPNRQLTVIFQPHLYSRTRDFLSEFGMALSLADETILVDLYPAREKPIPGIDSEALLTRVKNPNKAFVPKSRLVQYLKEKNRSLILLLGAGDLYKMNKEIIAVYC